MHDGYLLFRIKVVIILFSFHVTCSILLHIFIKSGGQQRRASLAVALLHEPDLIILDEPVRKNTHKISAFSTTANNLSKWIFKYANTHG